MGNSFSGTAPAYPASTAALCVLPLRTNGNSRFSITTGPMPRQLAARLAEAEYQGFIAGVNNMLQPLSSFGVLSLLLPFLIIDLLTIALLSVIDPWVMISPWDYPMMDLMLPLGLEFGVLFCSFPLMAYAINRRMTEVRQKVCEMLDDSSRRYGPRGLSFQLKQGVLQNGAGTNMWVEVQITPVIHVQSPIAIPVPSIYPVLLPSNATAAASPGAASASTAGAAAASFTAGSSSATPPADAGSGLGAQSVEYLRLLQENQLLRQYLSQCQTLIQQLTRQQQMQAHAAMQQAATPARRPPQAAAAHAADAPSSAAA